MAITIGSKVVRSLPEEVSELKKQVDIIKDIKLHYIHAIMFYSSDDKVAGSTFVVSDRATQYDAQTLRDYLIEKAPSPDWSADIRIPDRSRFPHSFWRECPENKSAVRFSSVRSLRIYRKPVSGWTVRQIS